MNIIFPNKSIHIQGEECDCEDFSIFLAGTIDNGKSTDWQQQLIDNISDRVPDSLTIYNPRRDNWDDNADIDTLRDQIDWEQKHLEICGIIVMVLLDDSKSPISLMELGEFCDSQKIMVFCTEKFYRFENVNDLCKRFQIPLYKTNDIKEISDKVLESIYFNIF